MQPQYSVVMMPVISPSATVSVFSLPPFLSSDICLLDCRFVRNGDVFVVAKGANSGVLEKVALRFS